VNIYSACNLVGKRGLWDQLRQLKTNLGGKVWCLVGDFNTVRRREKRRRSSNMSIGASSNIEGFNNFISDI